MNAFNGMNMAFETRNWPIFTKTSR